MWALVNLMAFTFLPAFLVKIGMSGAQASEWFENLSGESNSQVILTGLRTVNPEGGISKFNMHEIHPASS